MNAPWQNPVRRSISSLAFLSLAAVGACAHGGPATRATTQVFEVENRSPCDARVYVVSGNGLHGQSLGILPPGSTQRYRVMVPPGSRVGANAGLTVGTPTDIATACVRGNDLVHVRKLPLDA
jgi:hypothetical protein